MSDCRKCRDWHDCKAPPTWWNYSEIRFCPYQCLWIINQADTFREGMWPIEESPMESPVGKRQFKTEASFVMPELIIGEVEARLARTPNQGELLITQVEDGRILSNLSYGAREILMYIKGWRRKKMSFSAWKKDKKYRQKTYRKVVLK